MRGRATRGADDDGDRPVKKPSGWPPARSRAPTRSSAEAGPLICPQCGSTHPSDERFCPVCKVPLEFSASLGPFEPVSERHARARKIKPQLAEGELVRVVGARNQAEAEFIQGLLLEEGVPSLIRRSAGFDVPDFLAAGPRDILVPQAGLATAREVLLQAELIRAPGPRPGIAPVRLLAVLLIALAVGALVIWVGLGLVR